MVSKVLSGTRKNVEEQLNKILRTCQTVVSMSTCPSQTNGVIVVIIYKPNAIDNSTQQEYTK